MTETKILAGKHCKKEMEFRIMPVDDDIKSVLGWIIYGICSKCETVVMSSLFMQEEEPVMDRDFMIDYTKEVTETSSSKELKEKVYSKENEETK